MTSPFQVNHGNFMPVNPDTLVDVVFTNGRTDTGKAKCFYWSDKDLKRITNIAGMFLHRIRQWRVAEGVTQ